MLTFILMLQQLDEVCLESCQWWCRVSHLSQSLGVGAHVRQDDQHVLLTLIGQILG